MTRDIPATPRARARRRAAAAGVTVLGLTLAGCAADTSPSASGAGSTYLDGVLERPSPSSRAPLQTDIDFAAAVLQNHRDAVRLSEAFLARESPDGEVRQFAERVRDAQRPRIGQLEGMLRAWSAPVPDEQTLQPSAQAGPSASLSIDEEAAAEAKESTARMRAHRLTSGDWQALDTADADHLPSTYLLQIHRLQLGAVTLAEAEKAQGTDDAAKQVAREIVDGYRPEMERAVQILRARGAIGAEVPRSAVNSGYQGPIKLKGAGAEGGRVDVTPSPVLTAGSPYPGSSSASPSGGATPTPRPADTARPAPATSAGTPAASAAPATGTTSAPSAPSGQAPTPSTGQATGSAVPSAPTSAPASTPRG